MRRNDSKIENEVERNRTNVEKRNENPQEIDREGRRIEKLISWVRK